MTTENRDQRELISNWLAQRGAGSTSSVNTSTTSFASILSDEKMIYSEQTLSTVANSTKASLHVTPSSARVHIDVPNPTVDEAEDRLTTPNHVCCVIDVSASMSVTLKVKDEAGLAENTGLTTLDIVKFATLVIALSLNAQDKLSIIVYGDEAQIMLKPIHMTLDGKAKVKSTLDRITLQRRTNLIAGVELGVMQANNVGESYINSVFVLTDGMPTIPPPVSYEASMTAVLEECPVFGTVSMFGFGHSLDSQLLMELATMGGGTYSYIPDAGMVGTCFINALANSRCAYGVNPILKITGVDMTHLVKKKVVPAVIAKRNCAPERRTVTQKIGRRMSVKKRAIAKNGELVPNITVDGCLQTILHKDELFIKLTPLRYGSNIDIVLNPLLFEKNPENIQIELSFGTVGNHPILIECQPADANPSEELYHTTRAKFVKSAVEAASKPYPGDGADDHRFAVEVMDHKELGGVVPGEANVDLEALHEDMIGQATEAIGTEDSFNGWGKHFLLSLSTAHLHQFCNNFKDPGVQVYGNGVLFSFLQDLLDDIFECIPPPKGRESKVVKKVRMGQVFNNRNAVCVHGDTVVMVRKTGRTFIRNLVKGDWVQTVDGAYVPVECLVETTVWDRRFQRPFELVRVGTLCVTPYHPVKCTEQSGWQFPIDISRSDTNTTNNSSTAYSVYNLVLEHGHRHKPVLMDGIESITLGHGIVGHPVLEHSYFGTDAVVSDLQTVGDGSGWKAGHVVLNERNITRDGVSGRICGISDDETGTVWDEDGAMVTVRNGVCVV